jgi:hypothetical protein
MEVGPSLLTLLMVTIGSACGPPRVGSDSGDTGSTSSTEGGSTESSASTESESSTSTETESSTSTETATSATETDSETSGDPVCGDGIVDPQECSWPYCLSDCPYPPLACDNNIWSCGDGVDNDSDALIDFRDPDCLSPCDDSEDTLGPQQLIAGNPCKLDCFFDTNVGGGDDKCEWNVMCDPQSPGTVIGCPYNLDFAMSDAWCPAMQVVECTDQCLPLVANGCDCFGCCEIAGEFRSLQDLDDGWSPAEDCSADHLDACPACTPNLSCFNACEADDCELCLLAELAPGCEQPSCPEGIEPCTDPYGCAEGEFCQTGCCRPTSPNW